MNYPALSDMWRLDRALKLKSTNGNTQIVPNSQSRILARTRQVFPLTLFPDEIIVEELRIVWLRKNGPWSYEVVSIMATDIASVNAASGPFFGANRPGAKVSQGMIDSFWRQGMQAGHKNTFDCIKAFSETDFTGDLKKFDVPTLIVHGDDDQIVPIGSSALPSKHSSTRASESFRW